MVLESERSRVEPRWHAPVDDVLDLTEERGPRFRARAAFLIGPSWVVFVKERAWLRVDHLSEIRAQQLGDEQSVSVYPDVRVLQQAADRLPGGLGRTQEITGGIRVRTSQEMVREPAGRSPDHRRADLAWERVRPRPAIQR